MIYLARTAVMFFGLFFAVASRADGFAYVGAWSHHTGTDPENANRNHMLLAYERNKMAAGTFENSFGDRSYIAMIEAASVSAGNFEARILAGVVYGYRSCGNTQPDHSQYGPVQVMQQDPKRYCPAVVPEISYTRYRVQPALILLGSTPALTFKFKF